jgi:hypothetical protein
MSLDSGSASPPPFPLPSPAPPEFVETDTPCRKCSYNLRTQPIAGRCPECGTPVAISIYGDLLRYSEPRWIKNLSLGATLILVYIFLAIALVILGVVLGALRVLGSHGAAATFQLFTFAASFVGWVGSWLLTERDPSGVGEDQYGNIRKFIRITLLLGVAGSFVSSVFKFFAVAPITNASIAVAAGLLGLIGIAGEWAQLQYLSRLALRIPDQPLSGQAQLLKVWLCTFYAIYLVLGIIEGIAFAIRGSAAFGGIFMVGGCVAALIGLVLFVLGIMYVLMIDRFRRAFHQQAVLAQQIWGMYQG